MSINERVAQAVQVWQRVQMAQSTAGIRLDATGAIESPVQSTYKIAYPNVVYMGDAEWVDLPWNTDPFKIQGLTIIRVRLENYLQVAYVEGVE